MISGIPYQDKNQEFNISPIFLPKYRQSVLVIFPAKPH